MTDTLDYSDPDALIAASTEIDTYDFQNASDPDDRVSLALYQAPDGRFFRYLADSGYNSDWSGAIGEVTWYGHQRPATWTEA